MKMIRSIVRPEKVDDVVNALEAEGFVALTKVDVFGRGKQRGIQIDQMYYDELPKTMLIQVLEDEDVQKAVDIVVKNAKTGSIGDGKIFITEVEDAYTIRTGERGL